MATKQEEKAAEQSKAASDGASPGSDTLSVTDNRTGKGYELEITDGTIRTMDLRQIKVSDDDFGLMGYDPAFTNTASCRSAMRSQVLRRAAAIVDRQDEHGPSA